MEQPQDPAIVRIGDGVWGQQEDRSAGWPRHLSASAHEGRSASCPCRPLLESMVGVVAYPMVIVGTRLDCRNEHDWRKRYTGRYLDMDVVLMQCRFCEAIQAHDVSLDLLYDTDRTGARRLLTPLSKARRRDAIPGHYSGRRIAGRTYQ